MKAYAKVRITVEIEISNWGDNATIKEVFEKSQKEALEELDRYRAPLHPNSPPLRIIGDPEVIAVIQSNRS